MTEISNNKDNLSHKPTDRDVYKDKENTLGKIDLCNIPFNKKKKDIDEYIKEELSKIYLVKVSDAFLDNDGNVILKLQYVNTNEKKDKQLVFREIESVDISALSKEENVEVYEIKDTEEVSLRRVTTIHVLEEIRDAWKNQTSINVTVTNNNEKRECLLADYKGIKLQLPYQRLPQDGKNQEEYIKDNMDVLVHSIFVKGTRIDIKIDRSGVILKKKQEEAKNYVISHIEKGQVLEGRVTKLLYDGANVDIGGIEGFVSISDLSWGQIDKPYEAVVRGEKIKVVVLDYDKENETIKLGIKQLYPNPWDEDNAVFHIGDKVCGKVANIADFGAFIELQPGVKGLVHISELSYNPFKAVKDLLHIGQDLNVTIKDINYKNQKISLKAEKQDEDLWIDIDTKFKEGEIVRLTVSSTNSRALKCSLDNKYMAVCLARNIDIKKSKASTKFYKEGDSIKAKITNINKSKHVIFVSIKAIKEEEINKEYLKLQKQFKDSIPVNAIIIGFANNGSIELKFSTNFKGIVGTKDISWHTKVDGSTLYKEGQTIQVIIKSINRTTRNVVASIKMLEDPEWDRFSSHYSIGDKLSGQIQKVNEDGSLQIRTYSGLYGLITASDLYAEQVNPVKRQSVKAEIININSATHTIYLSLRILELEAVDEYSKQLQHGKDYNAKILSINNNEIIIDVDGHKGFICRQNATRSQDVNLHDIVHEGQTKKVWFLSCTDHKLQFLLKEVTSKEYPPELFEKNLEEILSDLDIRFNEFIFEVNDKNKAINLFQTRYEDNDFKGDGKLLIDRFDGEQIHPTLENESVEPGFYFGHLELRDIKERRENKNPYLFKLVDVVKLEGEEVNPYRYEDQLAFLQQADPSTNMSIASLLDEVGINLYKNKDRMFYELLQNADDASAKHGVQMRVQITDNYVIISHNGYPFNADDFKSITSAAQSTKKNRKQSTGYKGIGFKSVFSNSNKVLIKSGGFFFMFDKNSDEFKDFKLFYGKRNEISDWNKYIRKYSSAYEKFNTTPSIPWQLLPIWVEEMPEDLQGTLFDDGANVDIALKLDSNTADYNEAISKIIESPKFMLFLRHTRGIEINNRVISKDKDGNHIFIQSTSKEGDSIENSIESFIVVDDKIEISDEYFDKCGFNLIKKEMVLANGAHEMAIWRRLDDGTEENLSGSIPNKIAASDNTIISMAVPTDDNLVIQPLTSQEENRIYAYLPLRERRFKFHFYLNADFILASDREQIQGDNLWNQFIFYNVGKEIVSWVKQVGSKDQPGYLNLLQESLFPVLGTDVEDIKPLAEQFNRGYKEALETEKFILGHDDEWHSQDEIIYDESGLSQLIDCDLFCTILGSEKKLPHPLLNIDLLSKKELFSNIEYVNTKKVLSRILSDNRRFLAKERIAYKNMPIEQRVKVEEWLAKAYKANSDQVVDIVSYLPILTFNGYLKSISAYKKNKKNIILTDDIVPIKDIIEHTGLFISTENICKSALWGIISKHILLHIEGTAFNRVVRLTSSSSKTELDADEKVKLYQHYKSKEILRNYGIKEEVFDEWSLFCNINGKHTVIGSLARIEDGDDPYQFLSDYAIDDAEYKPVEDAGITLTGGKSVFEMIITHWEQISAKANTEELAIGLYELTDNFYKKFVDADGEYHNEKHKYLKTVFYDVKLVNQDQILLFKDLGDDTPLRSVLKKLYPFPVANEAITAKFATTPFFNHYDSILSNDFIEGAELAKEEIFLVLDALKGKQADVFSKYYIIQSNDDKYKFVKLNSKERQYYTTNPNIKELMSSIDTFHILPDEFKDYAHTSDNILGGEELIKIIFNHYATFTLNAGVVDAANDNCYVELQKLSQIDDVDIEKIRTKFSIQSSDGTISSKLSDIHLQENITVGGHTFTKDDLIPGQNATIKLATDIRAKLEEIHLLQSFLDKLFGVEQSGTDAAKEVFDQLNRSNYVLENGKQLAFILLYASENKDDVHAKVKTIKSDTVYDLAGSNFIYNRYDFIKDDFIISEQYQDIKTFLGTTFIYTNRRTNNKTVKIIDKPKVIKDYFIPNGFNLNEEAKIWSLLNYLIPFENESISNKDTIAQALQLDAKKMTLSKYVLEGEKLPDSILSWINDEETLKRESFIHNFFHIEDERSSSSIIRSFLSGDIKVLPNGINPHVPFVLEKTILWIKEKKLFLKKDQYEALHDFLNSAITDSVDFDVLRAAKSSLDEYEKVGDYIVYAYNHEIPHVVNICNGSLTIYTYNKGDAIVDGNDIYYNYNSGKDLLQVLAELAGDDNQRFSPNDLVSYIKDKNQGAYVGGNNDYTSRSKNEQADYSLEAQNIILNMLHDDFDLDISIIIRGYSSNIISGCKTKDGITIPLVIKSYLYHDAPLHINPEEWEQLCKPNALLAVRYEKDRCGCYKFKDLLQAKDKMVLTFDSQNLNIEDRFNKFAELYKWFNGFHFDFSKLAEPEFFDKDTELLDCLFNDKQNAVSKADTSNDDIGGIE